MERELSDMRHRNSVLQAQNEILMQQINAARKECRGAQNTLATVLRQLQTSGTKLVKIDTYESSAIARADLCSFAKQTFSFAEQMRHFANHLYERCEEGFEDSSRQVSNMAFPQRSYYEGAPLPSSGGDHKIAHAVLEDDIASAVPVPSPVLPIVAENVVEAPGPGVSETAQETEAPVVADREVNTTTQAAPKKERESRNGVSTDPETNKNNETAQGFLAMAIGDAINNTTDVPKRKITDLSTTGTTSLGENDSRGSRDTSQARDGSVSKKPRLSKPSSDKNLARVASKLRHLLRKENAPSMNLCQLIRNFEAFYAARFDFCGFVKLSELLYALKPYGIVVAPGVRSFSIDPEYEKSHVVTAAATGKPRLPFHARRRSYDPLVEPNMMERCKRERICAFFNQRKGCHHDARSCEFDHVCLECHSQHHGIHFCPRAHPR